MRVRLAFLRLVRPLPFQERVDLPGIHGLLVQARHALRPRRNLHNLALGTVLLSLVQAAHTVVSCCLLLNEEHRLPHDGITRLNHFTHPPKMRAALRLSCSRHACFKYRIEHLRSVPCGWYPTCRYWLLARLCQAGHFSRCLPQTELAHSFANFHPLRDLAKISLHW